MMPTENNVCSAHDVWVVFSGRTEIWWLRFLKIGFRHCYLIMHDGRHWISYDPLSPHTEITIHYNLACEFRLPEWLAQQGDLPVRVRDVWRAKKPAPLMVYSCVEAVKRVLGIHSRMIITPWQLYRYLYRQLATDI